MLMFNKQELHHVDCESLTPTQGSAQQRVDCASLAPIKGPRNKAWIAST